jgi:hypothetical protein
LIELSFSRSWRYRVLSPDSHWQPVTPVARLPDHLSLDYFAEQVADVCRLQNGWSGRDVVLPDRLGSLDGSAGKPSSMFSERTRGNWFIQQRLAVVAGHPRQRFARACRSAILDRHHCSAKATGARFLAAAMRKAERVIARRQWWLLWRQCLAVVTPDPRQGFARAISGAVFGWQSAPTHAGCARLRTAAVSLRDRIAMASNIAGQGGPARS